MHSKTLIAILVFAEISMISTEINRLPCYVGTSRMFHSNVGVGAGYDHCQYHIHIEAGYTTAHGRGKNLDYLGNQTAHRQFLVKNHIHECGKEYNPSYGTRLHCKCYGAHCNVPLGYEDLLSSNRNITINEITTEEFYNTFF